MLQSTRAQDVALEACSFLFCLFFIAPIFYISLLALVELNSHLAGYSADLRAALRTRTNLIARDVCVYICACASMFVCALVLLDFAAVSNSPPALPAVVVNYVWIYVVFSCAVLFAERALLQPMPGIPLEPIFIPLAKYVGAGMCYCLLSSALIAICRFISPQHIWLVEFITQAGYVSFLIAVISDGLMTMHEVGTISDLLSVVSAKVDDARTLISNHWQAILWTAVCTLCAIFLSAMAMLGTFVFALALRARRDGNDFEITITADRGRR